MVHVADLTGTVHLLEALGGEVVQGSRDGDWVQVAIGGAGVTIARATSAEGLGRQLQLRTPDGLLVKLNEVDAELIG